MRLAVAALVLLLTPSLASAQRVPAFQDGAVLKNDPLKAITGGRHGTAAGLTGDINGLGMNPFSITDSNGIGVCANSAAATGTLGVNYHAFCYGHNASGLPIWRVDGTDYAFGTNTGNMLGPNSTTVGHLVAWNNTAGSLTADPGTAILTAGGLGVAVGETLAANAANIAFQVKRTSTTVDSGKADSGIFSHSSWGGNDSQANVQAIYGDLWYNGSSANQAYALKGNVYTYAASGSPSGSLPTQYFSSPNIGTLPYLVGVYGRTAVYLPGTITYAAAIMADGIYNIGTGATVTNNIAFLAAPGAAKDAAAASYAFFLKSGSGCSPTCWTATFKAENDPLVFATKNGTSFAVNDLGGSTAIANYLAVIGNVATGDPQLAALGGDTNIGINLVPKGTGSVTTPNSLLVGLNQTCGVRTTGATGGTITTAGAGACNLTLAAVGSATINFSSNSATQFSVGDGTGTIVNYLTAYGSVTGSPAQLAALGTDAAIGIRLATKGAKGVMIGNPTGGAVANQGSINIEGTINTNGTPGIASQTCTVNQAKTLIFTNGLLTGGNCNT